MEGGDRDCKLAQLSLWHSLAEKPSVPHHISTEGAVATGVAAWDVQGIKAATTDSVEQDYKHDNL